MSDIIKKTLLAVSLLAVLPQAQAHRQWLLPSSTQVEAKEPWVTVDGAVSESLFEFDTNALNLDGLVIIAPDGALINPENSYKAKFRSSVDIKLSQDGTYKISNLSSNVNASYSLNGEQKRWRGNEANMAKEIPTEATDIKVTRTFGRLDTFVSSAKPNTTALKAAGEGLELVPITHPNEAFAQEKSTFQLLLNGKPLANTTVSIIAGGVRYRGTLGEVTVDSNDKGMIEVIWPYAAMYWLNVNYPKSGIQADGTRAPAPEKRYNYALTMEVLPQ